MKEFVINVRETLETKVTVAATNEQEALEQVKSGLENGEYVLNMELLKAWQDGRVVILPAKTVYELTWDAGPDCDLICPVSIGGEGCCDFCEKGELCVYERECKQEHIEQLGKTVFLTREEAERAKEEEE